MLPLFNGVKQLQGIGKIPRLAVIRCTHVAAECQRSSRKFMASGSPREKANRKRLELFMTHCGKKRAEPHRSHICRCY